MKIYNLLIILVLVFLLSSCSNKDKDFDESPVNYLDIYVENISDIYWYPSELIFSDNSSDVLFFEKDELLSTANDMYFFQYPSQIYLEHIYVIDEFKSLLIENDLTLEDIDVIEKFHEEGNYTFTLRIKYTSEELEFSYTKQSKYGDYINVHMRINFATLETELRWERENITTVSIVEDNKKTLYSVTELGEIFSYRYFDFYNGEYIVIRTSLNENPYALYFNKEENILYHQMGENYKTVTLYKNKVPLISYSYVHGETRESIKYNLAYITGFDAVNLTKEKLLKDGSFIDITNEYIDSEYFWIKSFSLESSIACNAISIYFPYTQEINELNFGYITEGLYFEAISYNEFATLNNHFPDELFNQFLNSHISEKDVDSFYNSFYEN